MTRSRFEGFRIELGEIESVLLRYSGVKQAVVLAVANDRGEKSLVAYVVGSAGGEELRSYLRGQLPDYMMPAAIVELPKFPLNANGKIDRPALPKPEDVHKAQTEPVAPRTPSEEVIAAIWGEVLRRDGIGVEDNFFEIGGHSLLATQIASRLREHFRLPVAVRTIFEAPTIAEMARRLEVARREEQGLVSPRIKPVPREHDLPLSFAQERLWVLDQMEPNNPLYNIPRSLRLRGELQVAGLESAVNRNCAPARIATHHLRRERGASGAADCTSPSYSARGSGYFWGSREIARRESADDCHGGGETTIQPGYWSPRKGPLAATSRRRPRAVVDDASHHQ